MSRWSDQFGKHAIHETIRQSLEWAQEEFEGTNSELEAERRRVLKVLGLISSTIEGMDPEFFPEAELTQLNNHMRQQQFWNQLSNYAKNGDAQNLRTANDHMDSQVPRIYQIAAKSIAPESQKAIKGVEDAFDRFCKTIEAAEAKFNSTLAEGVTALSSLKKRVSDVEATHKSLTEQTEKALNDWSTEHTEAQNDRSTKFSNSEIDRTKSFEKSLKVIEEKANDRQEKIFFDLAALLDKRDEEVSKRANEIIHDMEIKHQSILKTHDIVAGDGVAGGYKKTAKDEGDAANLWRTIAMRSFIAAALWTLFKVIAYWSGWVSTNPASFDWPEVIAATSLTLILLATATYAARQSKLHRVNEQQMSWFSLEIGALDPFIASLSEEQQRVLKIQLSQRLFGQNRTASVNDSESSENELVKTVLDAVTQLTRKGE